MWNVEIHLPWKLFTVPREREREGTDTKSVTPQSSYLCVFVCVCRKTNENYRRKNHTNHITTSVCRLVYASETRFCICLDKPGGMLVRFLRFVVTTERWGNLCEMMAPHLSLRIYISLVHRRVVSLQIGWSCWLCKHKYIYIIQRRPSRQFAYMMRARRDNNVENYDSRVNHMWRGMQTSCGLYIGYCVVSLLFIAGKSVVWVCDIWDLCSFSACFTQCGHWSYTSTSQSFPTAAPLCEWEIWVVLWVLWKTNYLHWIGLPVTTVHTNPHTQKTRSFSHPFVVWRFAFRLMSIFTRILAHCLLRPMRRERNINYD